MAGARHGGSLCMGWKEMTYLELRFLSVLTVTGVPLSEPARP